MSISNDIKLLLDIQDENIYFEENAVEYKEFKGKTAKFITGKLTYTPSHCECCGVKNENYTIYKNGTKTSRITLPFTGIYPTYLLLKKQRFFCKACNSTFIAKSSVVERHCFISKQTRAQVLIKSADTQTITSISHDCSVSPSTVQRIISEEVKPYKFSYNSLPEHLSFDEFRYGKGKFAFEYINAETGEILGILSSRDGYTV
ncbi:transposase family protein, partial [Globicatella sulfidifaciens]